MISSSHSVHSVPTSWRMYKVHLVMQPHGSQGWFRSISMKFCWKTAYEVCKWFIMIVYSHTIKNVPTSWRMYIVHLVMYPNGCQGWFRFISMKFCWKTAVEVCKWYIMIFYSYIVQSMPTSWRMYKCILWCSHMVVRVKLDLYHSNQAKRQLTKLANVL